MLIVFLLVFIFQSQVEACYCNNTGATYWKCDTMSLYYRCILIHEFDIDGNVTDRHFSYPICTEEDDCYWVMRVHVNSTGTKTLIPSRIIISDDTNISLYQDTSGNTQTYTYDQYSGTNRGNYNNKYYFLDSSTSYMILNESNDAGYEILYNSIPFSYVIESEDSYNDIVDLAIWLCGGDDAELPGSVSIPEKEPVYDLEPPLNVKLSLSDLSMNKQIYGDGLYQGSSVDIPFKIWWGQSNIDLTGYETQFFVKEYGRYKKSLFSSWTDVVTPYYYDVSLVTAKYYNNSLKYYEFSPNDKKRIYQYSQEVAGEEPYSVEFYFPDFMLRNIKKGEDGQMHYSNWVYVKIYEDGTYSVFEMEQEYELEEDPDETGNIDVDSPNYDDEIIYEETDYSPDIGGVKDSAKFITVLKDLANSLGDFPDLFAQIFSFLPNWVLVCIGTLFVVIMLKGIF